MSGGVGYDLWEKANQPVGWVITSLSELKGDHPCIPYIQIQYCQHRHSDPPLLKICQCHVPYVMECLVWQCTICVCNFPWQLAASISHSYQTQMHYQLFLFFFFLTEYVSVLSYHAKVTKSFLFGTHLYNTMIWKLETDTQCVGIRLLFLDCSIFQTRDWKVVGPWSWWPRINS